MRVDSLVRGLLPMPMPPMLGNPLSTEYSRIGVPDVDDDIKVRGPNDRSNISSFGDELMEVPSGDLYLSGTSVVDDRDRAVYVEESRQRDVGGTNITEYQYTRGAGESCSSIHLERFTTIRL